MSNINHTEARDGIGPNYSVLLTWYIPVALVAANAYILFFGTFTRSFFSLIKHLYNFNTIIVPPILLISSGFIILFLKRNIVSKKHLFISIGYILIAFALFGLRVYATHIEPYKLVVRTATINTGKISKPLRILHITDIQADRVDSYLERVFNDIKKLNPDLILFTGDLLQPIPPYTIESELPKINNLFNTLDPPLGIYGVIGDVDHFLTGQTRQRLDGLQFLEGEELVISDKDMNLNIYGLSQNQSRSDINTLTQHWLETASKNDFSILMGHAPDYILSMNNMDVDLCLAGHTHGGQIRIPFLGPIVTLSSVPGYLARGFHEIGNTRINVSAGIGSEHMKGLPAIRFNCPTEMTMIELAPLDEEAVQANP
jgi:uncharacterized protein